MLSISSLVNSEEFSEYEKYGVSYDSETGDLMYKGEPVSFLYVMGETEGEIEMCISLPSDMEAESGETKGICVSKDADGTITGITGIEERANAVDGTLTVESPRGGPTTLRASLPLGRENTGRVESPRPEAEPSEVG